MIPMGLGLEGTKWENYRLRGTQVDFVTSIGAPTVLANSQIESGFQQRSSCITCHALAFMDSRGMNIGFPTMVGSPNPRDFVDPATGRPVMQADFVWSMLLRAASASQ